MPKAMSMLLALFLACFMALGCRDHHLEKGFFDKPPADRVERLRQYSLDDQYKTPERTASGLFGPALSLS